MPTELEASKQDEGRTYYPPIDPGGHKSNAETVSGTTTEETAETSESQQTAG